MQSEVLVRHEELTRHVPVDGVPYEKLSVRAPFTGTPIADVPMCVANHVDSAVADARQAQKAWAETPFSQRRTIILRYHDLVLEARDELMDLMQLESGKARRHALEEVLDVAITARYYALNAGKFLKPRRRRGAVPLLTHTVEHRHPVGVVGLIAPWNYPLSLAISDALPALMAGNAVVLKPAEQTSLTALKAAALLYEAGLPKALFQVVTGRGPEVGPPLIDSVDFIGFTGSTHTGRIVARQAAERLIHSSMELGGKNPAIVLDDADLDRAVEGLVRGSFTNSGQLCISIERLYVQSGIYDAFMARFVERVRQMRVGSSFDFDVEMGSLVSQEQLDKVREHVEDAVARGATVRAGGRARPDLGPFFFEPTVLENVSQGMMLFGEETFGPVVSVYRFDDVEEAIRLANASDYGLNASIWTRNTRRGRQIARRIHCGTVNVNEAYSAAWGSVDAPMGGMKNSGMGRRHGREGILKYTEAQTVSTQRLIPLTPQAGIDAALYARIVPPTLRLLRRIPFVR